MQSKQNASIFEAGTRYRLHDATLSNEEIASRLSSNFFVGSGSIAYENQGQPPGTFWVGGNGMTSGYLIAIRTAENEVTFVWPFYHSKLKQAILTIAEPVNL